MPDGTPGSLELLEGSLPFDPEPEGGCGGGGGPDEGETEEEERVQVLGVALVEPGRPLLDSVDLDPGRFEVANTARVEERRLATKERVGRMRVWDRIQTSLRVQRTQGILDDFNFKKSILGNGTRHLA